MAQRKAYGNQKKIQVQKVEVKEGDKFIYQNLKAIHQAMYCLRSPAGFKLYMYLAEKNTGKDKWWNLSNKDFKDKTGFSKTAYDTAVAELVKIGYLKKLNDDNCYLFKDYIEANEEQLKALMGGI